MLCPIINNRFAIDPNAIAILSGEADYVVSRFRGRENARPARRVIRLKLRSDAGERPREVPFRIDSPQYRRAFKLGIVKIFGLQPMRGPGLAGIQHRSGNGTNDRPDEACAL